MSCVDSAVQAISGLLGEQRSPLWQYNIKAGKLPNDIGRPSTHSYTISRELYASSHQRFTGRICFSLAEQVTGVEWVYSTVDYSLPTPTYYLALVYIHAKYYAVNKIRSTKR